MQATIERQGGALICHESDRIGEVGEILLNDAAVDLVVVKGLVTEKSLLDALRNDLLNPSTLTDLYAHVENLTELDTAVSTYWVSNGYNDYEQTSTKLVPGFATYGSTKGPHTDFLDDKLDPMMGPITMSICTAGQGLYYAEKPPHSYKTPDGKFDKLDWSMWKKTGLVPGLLRSSAVQYKGDAVMFMGHPLQTFHHVVDKSQVAHRHSSLLDYTVQKKSLVSICT